MTTFRTLKCTLVEIKILFEVCLWSGGRHQVKDTKGRMHGASVIKGLVNAKG